MVRASAEADRKWWQLITDTGPELNQVELEEVTERSKHLRERLLRDLRARLTSGELIARGFREPISQTTPYLTISRHEWRVILLESPGETDTSGRAAGAGIAYIGLTIGKPRTKRLLRRGIMNRHEEPRAVIRGVHCGWRGCTESFNGRVAPPGWVCLIAYHSPKPILDIKQIADWRHDKVLCPAHAKELDNLLYPSLHGDLRAGILVKRAADASAHPG